MDPESFRPVCEEHALDLLVLFGSHAAGRPGPRSDVDLGYVRPTGRLTADARARLETRLKPILPPGDVDLVDVGRAPGLLRHVAAERGRLLYERAPGVFTRFRVQAWLLSQDERLQIRRHDREGIAVALQEQRR